MRKVEREEREERERGERGERERKRERGERGEREKEREERETLNRVPQKYTPRTTYRTLYVLGGISDSDGHILNSTEFLSPERDSFIIGPPMPVSLAHHCLTVVNSTHTFFSGGLGWDRMAKHSGKVQGGPKETRPLRS